MAIDLPINAPLTEAQGELTAKIGSMKSLLALPSIRKRNIPKGNQISAFDYLLKLLDTMSLSPEVIFNIFLTKVFDEAGTFLEDKVLDGIGDSIGENGTQINPYINNPIATKDEKKIYKASNKAYIRSLIPNTFLQTVKQDLAKKLVVMIFGQPNTTPASLVTNQAEVNRLVGAAVCGEGLFSLSNDPIVRNQDIEYNRIKLREQLEKGEVQFEISCQTVKIKLPEDPGFIFNGGTVVAQSNSAPPTPAQSLSYTVQYVNNQVQRINNEANANKSGKKFFQILIEKLLSFISTMVEPYLPNLFAAINSTLPPSQHLSMGDFVYDACAIKNDTSNEVKKEFSKSLFNALLKDLLKLLLLFAIKKFKQLIANYISRTALEKQKRKLDKARLKFKVFSQLADNADKIQKYQAALTTLSGVLGSIT
jgi:hypothetical protein